MIQRSYRDDIPPSYIERFLPIILEIEEEGQQITPCFSREGINYMHIRHSNLYRTYFLDFSGLWVLILSSSSGIV